MDVQEYEYSSVIRCSNCKWCAESLRELFESSQIIFYYIKISPLLLSLSGGGAVAVMLNSGKAKLL